ncbi:thioester domain-containing protein [Streptomyces sp. HNM0574]|uniref:thioester domain-containing protein n=1 Tax=Streptomyces sp. HNM0574 TaxID=2714954 RepID=UPI00146A08ED|nr:thioester domain-containing protein [Streptomyces sp. HNM0574]NLU66422.1 TQXA domain-containing protein [Streptomyces sp. HNM0574]
MTFVRRRSAARVAAAVVAPGLLAAGTVAGAGPAAAEDEAARTGGAAATLEGLRISDEAVVRREGEERRTGAGLFEMAVDGGGRLQTYSVDIDNPALDQARYEEASWKTSSLHDNRNAGKIRWILEHSYPKVDDLHALARTSGSGRLTPETAAAGTQVAIWRYSDRAEVEAADPAAEKLADFLQERAGKMAEPSASLSLGSSAVAGRPGDRLGPVTVRTGAPSVAVAPAPDAAARGVKLVDADGKQVTSARDGSKLYFQLPGGESEAGPAGKAGRGRDAGEAGEAAAAVEAAEPAGEESGSTSLTVTASTKVPVGRVLTGTGEHAKSQTQILAGSSQSTVSATASARWGGSGAVPVAHARKNCADGSVDVTVTNGGDEPYGFSLAGKKYEVAPGHTRTAPVTVQEDQAYRIALPGAAGEAEPFMGVLDCETVTRTAAEGADEGVTPQGAPDSADTTGTESGGSGPGTIATAGSDGGEAVSGEAGQDPDLAETGNSSNTPLIIGIAVALVLVGAVALLAVRRREPEQDASGDGSAEDGATESDAVGASAPGDSADAEGPQGSESKTRTDSDSSGQ